MVNGGARSSRRGRWLGFSTVGSQSRRGIGYDPATVMPPMHIATYTRRRRSKGGPIFLHEAGAAPIPVALFWGCYRCICDHVVCMSRCRCCRQCWCSSCVGCLLSSRNVYQLYATREVCDEASERGSEDYMDSVMSKTPPTAKKAVGSGALVVTIAIIPPSKATTPTTAMLDRLT